MGAAELIDPESVYRLATIETSSGLHTYPTRDGEPVILDPRQTRNTLRAGLFRARRNGSARPVALTPTQAIDWVAEILGIPGGTARSRLNRAMAGLRAALEADARPSLLEARAGEGER